MMLLLALLACTDKDGTTPIETGDTGLPECGRLRGIEGVLMFTEGDSVHAPVDAPDSTTYTHSVAGPLSDGLTWLASEGGQIQQSVDAGCNWDRVGSLPATGWWNLLAAGDRVYAFDRGSGDGARTDDAGVSWTPFDTGGPFVGRVAVDPSDGNRLRGVQTRGVVTTSDGGDSWQVTGGVPAGTLRDASVSAQDLDTLVVGTDTGVQYTRGGGTTWDEVGTGLPQDTVTPGVTVPQVAVHPDDLNVLFALSVDTTGLATVSRSTDHGGTWSRLVDTDAVKLADDSDLHPVPGHTDQVVSTYATGVDAHGMDLFTISAGTGTHTLHVGVYFGVNDLVFASDRWLAAVDGVVD